MNNLSLSSVTTLFLDVGNTMVSMDFPWLCEKLDDLGVQCVPEQLQRAEAAVRPVIAKKVQNVTRKEKLDVFLLYLETVLRESLDGSLTDADLSLLVRKLAPALLPDGKTDRLWSCVLPGVRKALDTFKGLQLQLVIVSNSDGSIERSMNNLGLRDYFDAVIDSHVVGVEKPNPRIFEVALQAAGAERESTLHVGDMLTIDVVGAQSAGIRGVLVDPFGDWGSVDCPTVKDLLELSRLLAAERY